MVWRALLFWALLTSRAVAGDLVAMIDLSDQKMTVFVDQIPIHQWPVSTARPGKFTPIGLYHVQSMRRMHYSSLYNNAPMPHTIFFSGNFAIHGTTDVDQLGTPASAGCVRLHPDDAATLFALVLEHGRENALIEIVR